MFARRGLAALLLSLAVAVVVGTGNDRAGHRDCGSCHLRPEGAGWQGGSSLCLDCHETRSLDGRGHEEAGRSAATSPLTGHVLASGASRFALGFEEFGCLSCHAAHDNGRPFQLRVLERSAATGPADVDIDPMSRFCLDCHPKFGETRGTGGHYVRHPIGVPVPRMRRNAEAASLLPLADPRGTESVTDDVIACWTCHVTHASSNPFLLRYREEQQIEVCTTCHEIGGPPTSRASTM